MKILVAPVRFSKSYSIDAIRYNFLRFLFYNDRQSNTCNNFNFILLVTAYSLTRTLHEQPPKLVLLLLHHQLRRFRTRYEHSRTTDSMP